MTATFRIDPDEYEERLTLLRSGRFARARRRIGGRGDGSERAILAHPDHSLRAFREIPPEIGPWTIVGDAQATPLQAYQQALDSVESNSGNNFFDATHGGAILLEYPQNLKEIGFSTDYEVV